MLCAYRLPAEALPAIQAELGRRVLERFEVSADSLFYDVTNFYTFIDSRNKHCHLPQRGRNKQKRNDLRRFQVGMLAYPTPRIAQPSQRRSGPSWGSRICCTHGR